LIDMDLTQTIHVPVYRPVKDFNIQKNRILKSNISQLPFSPLSTILSPTFRKILEKTPSRNLQRKFRD
jgi:hypothetical protein